MIQRKMRALTKAEIKLLERVVDIHQEGGRAMSAVWLAAARELLRVKKIEEISAHVLGLAVISAGRHELIGVDVGGVLLVIKSKVLASIGYEARFQRKLEFKIARAPDGCVLALKSSGGILRTAPVRGEIAPELFDKLPDSLLLDATPEQAVEAIVRWVESEAKGEAEWPDNEKVSVRAESKPKPAAAQQVIKKKARRSFNSAVTEKFLNAVLMSKSDKAIELLGRGADPNGVCETGSTAAHTAALWGDEAVLRALIKAGANMNAVEEGDQGFAPLHAAVRGGSTQAIQLLVSEAKININQRDDWGRTAFDIAMEDERPELVKILVDAGADTRGKDASKLLKNVEKKHAEKLMDAAKSLWKYSVKAAVDPDYKPTDEELKAVLEAKPVEDYELTRVEKLAWMNKSDVDAFAAQLRELGFIDCGIYFMQSHGFKIFGMSCPEKSIDALVTELDSGHNFKVMVDFCSFHPDGVEFSYTNMDYRPNPQQPPGITKKSLPQMSVKEIFELLLKERPEKRLQPFKAENLAMRLMASARAYEAWKKQRDFKRS